MTSRLPLALGIVAAVFVLAAGLRAQTAVQFVGCQSDGQTGPLPAPAAPDGLIQIDADAARQLTYYKAENGPGVLGPRGWNCFGFYGSNGDTLIVTPRPVDTTMAMTTTRLPGQAIQLSWSSGETSGRFEVARVVARVFPAHQNFVQHVIAEGILPAGDFPLGAFPRDRLTYLNDHVVEFQTPAGADGLGTMSRLQRSGDAIRGVAMLRNEAHDLQNAAPDLLLLAARLPPAMSALAPKIIQQVEQLQ